MSDNILSSNVKLLLRLGNCKRVRYKRLGACDFCVRVLCLCVCVSGCVFFLLG